MSRDLQNLSKSCPSFGSLGLPTPPYSTSNSPSVSPGPRKRSYTHDSTDRHDSVTVSEHLADRSYLLGLIASCAHLSDTGISLSDALLPILEAPTQPLVHVKEHYVSRMHPPELLSGETQLVRTLGGTGPVVVPHLKPERKYVHFEDVEAEKEDEDKFVYRSEEKKLDAEELIEELERLWTKIEEKDGATGEDHETSV